MSIQSKKGFTLLEILIVLIILGVIAGLAIPAFTTQVEKNRGQEALHQLALMREAVLRFAAQNNGNFPLPVAMPVCNGNGQQIDYNPRCSSGQLNFDYSIIAAGSVQATRRAGVNNPGNCAGAILTLAPGAAGGGLVQVVDPNNSGCYV